MTATETERCTNLLQAKLAELTGSLRNRDEIAIEKASDVIDQVQLMGNANSPCAVSTAIRKCFG